MNMARESFQSRLFTKMSPAQFLALSYLTVLSVGTVLLRLPLSSVTGSLSWVDALFMSTSALCVTGLAVVTVGTDLTIFGQVVIMLLIQIGALGIMTMSTLFALLLGRRIGLRNRILLQEDRNQSALSGVVRLVRYVLVVTLIVEAIGALTLFAAFLSQMASKTAAYYAVFHSISAFGNAGFDLFGDSLVRFGNNGFIQLVFMALFILGGLGFSVIFDLLQSRSVKQWSLHTKLVIGTTLALITLAWVIILGLEFANGATIGELSLTSKLWTSLFTAVTPRTAGFNVVPTANLTLSSLFFIIVLMFIGASPGSTGGGIKTTTFVTLILGAWSTIAGKKDVEVTNRRIPREQVDKAFTIVLLSLTWICVVTLIVLITDRFDFMQTLFEVVSAFGTVGLSMGITPELSIVAKILITITMFIGRLGPMTLALALGERSGGTGQIRYPEEKISLG